MYRGDLVLRGVPEIEPAYVLPTPGLLPAPQQKPRSRADELCFHPDVRFSIAD